METTPDRPTASVAAGSEAASPLPTTVGPREMAPYLGATILAMVAMVALVVAGLPAAPVVQVGLTFLATALVARRLDDLEWEAAHPVLAWVGDRLDALGDKFGVEFYGLASLTHFLRAEVISLLETSLSVADLLASPFMTVLTWILTETLESLMNALWAFLWWMDLLDAVGGVGLFVVTVAAGWTVWRVLEIAPRPYDPFRDGFGEELEADLHGIGADLEDLQALDFGMGGMDGTDGIDGTHGMGGDGSDQGGRGGGTGQGGPVSSRHGW